MNSKTPFICKINELNMIKQIESLTFFVQVLSDFQNTV